MATDPRFCCFFSGHYREAHLLPGPLMTRVISVKTW
jgi:hypothetical protein